MRSETPVILDEIIHSLILLSLPLCACRADQISFQAQRKQREEENGSKKGTHGEIIEYSMTDYNLVFYQFLDFGLHTLERWC